MAVLEFIQRGGYFMWPVLVLAIAAAVIAVERILSMRNSHIDVGQFVMRLRGIFKSNGPDAALAFCSRLETPVANIVREGILRHGRAEEHLSRVLASARVQELFRLRRRIAYLTGIGGVAALLGLLGTVIGIIGALQDVQAQRGLATLSDIAGSLWPALMSTAFGLGVGLLCLVSERYLVAGVDRIGRDMEMASADLLDMLAETRATRGEQKRKESPPRLPAIADYEDEFFRRKS